MEPREPYPRRSFYPGEELRARINTPRYDYGELDGLEFGADHTAIMDCSPIENHDRLLVRTDHFDTEAKYRTDTLRSRIVGPADAPDTAERRSAAEWLGQIDAALQGLMDDGNGEALRVHGFDFGRGWPVDVAARIVQRKPILIYSMTGQPDLRTFCSDPYANPEQSGLEHIGLGRSLRRLVESTPGCQVVLLDDTIDVHTEQRLTSTERQQYVRGVEASLKGAEIVPLASRDGRDYFIRPASALANRFDLLIAMLRSGDITPGNTHFMPTEAFLSEHNTQSEAHRARLLDEGVPLLNQDGTPTKAALLACNMLDYINTKYMHVFIADIRDKDAYEDAYVMLCTISKAYHTMFRPFYVDFENLPPDIADYGIMKALELGNKTYQSYIERYVDAPHMQVSEAKEYFREEYGSGADGNECDIHGDDLAGVRELVPLLPRLFPRGIESVAIPGYGQYSWPAQALAPFLVPGAFMHATDIAAANIALTLGYKEGTLDDEFMAVGPKYGRVLLDVGGERYGVKPEDSDALLRARLLPGYGDITKLPKGAYQVVVDSFVGYAMCSTLQQYYEIVQGEADALSTDPNATLISLCVVGRKEGWRRYPAVNLPSDDVIRQAHYDAGLERVMIIPLKTDYKFHHGYSHVSLVIARRGVLSQHGLMSILEAHYRPGARGSLFA